MGSLAADPSHAEVRHLPRDRLMELIVMQDYPKDQAGCICPGRSLTLRPAGAGQSQIQNPRMPLCVIMV